MKFGVMFDFSDPTQWRRPDPALYRSHLDEIVRLEELGYHNVWLTDHHFVEDGYNPSVLSVAAAIAVRTSRIRIGTFVLLLPFHNPVRVAEDAICIDILSSGRFDLGVGQGYRAEEFAALNIPRAERSARLAEAIELIHRLFKEKAITLEDKYNHVNGMTLYPRPVQPNGPPIWIGCARRRRPNAPRGWAFICWRRSGRTRRFRIRRRCASSGVTRRTSTSRNSALCTSRARWIKRGTRPRRTCTA